MDMLMIDRLHAGPELDKLVARQVMKHKIVMDDIFGLLEMYTTEKGENIYQALHPYSQDLACAQYVIHKMDEMAFHDATAYWRGDDRPEIICKAALRAVFQRKKEEDIHKRRSVLRIVK
ncbi:hypothetical protein [Desulfocastanea catecholica]